MTQASEGLEEKVLSSELVYRGRAVTIRKVVVEMPTGRRGSRVIIEHPGSVAVVPFLTTAGSCSSGSSGSPRAA